jgi:hypothetical protein
MSQPFDETLVLETVEPVGHRARGHEQRLGDRRGRKPVGGTRPSQREEHVGLGNREAVFGRERRESLLDAAGDVKQPCNGGHCPKVEIGPLVRPLAHEPVDRIGFPRRHAKQHIAP